MIDRHALKMAVIGIQDLSQRRKDRQAIGLQHKIPFLADFALLASWREILFSLDFLLLLSASTSLRESLQASANPDIQTIAVGPQSA
jgi:hypothetical protein